MSAYRRRDSDDSDSNSDDDHDGDAFEELCAELRSNSTNLCRICLNSALFEDAAFPNPRRPLQNSPGIRLGAALQENTNVMVVDGINLAWLFPNRQYEYRGEDEAALAENAAGLLQFICNSTSLRHLSFHSEGDYHIDDTSYEVLVTQFCGAIAASSSIEHVEFQSILSSKGLGLLFGSKSLKSLKIERILDTFYDDYLSDSAWSTSSALEAVTLGDSIVADTAESILRHLGRCSKLRALTVRGPQTLSLIRRIGGPHSTVAQTVQTAVGVPTIALPLVWEARSPEQCITHLHLRSFSFRGDMEILVSILMAKPVLVLAFDFCSFSERAVAALTRYTNTPTNAQVLRELTLGFARSAVPDNGDTDAFVTAVLRPLPLPLPQSLQQQNMMGTIGSKLESLTIDAVHCPLSQFFQLLRDEAFRIHLKHLTLNHVEPSTAPALMDSIPHWVHLQEFSVTTIRSPYTDIRRELLRALRANGSLLQVHFGNVTFSPRQVRMIQAYSDRNREVPFRLAGMVRDAELNDKAKVPMFYTSMIPARTMCPFTMLLGLKALEESVGY